MRPFLPALAGLLLLGGCVSAGGSGAVRPLSESLSTGARVTAVTLRNTPQNTSAGFDARFTAGVQSKLDECATGSQPLTLDITLSGYYAPNAAMALFAPMKSEVSGMARLRDAAGAVVGEYRIERSILIGGWLGAVVALRAETNMTDAFGAELCKQAFAA